MSWLIHLILYSSPYMKYVWWYLFRSVWHVGNMWKSATYLHNTLVQKLNGVEWLSESLWFDSFA